MGYEIRGNQLYHEGQKLHLLGVNLVGMELREGVIFGLGWAGKTMAEFVSGIRDCGFNAVRLPITTETLYVGRSDRSMIDPRDSKIQGAAPIVILDALIEELEKQGIRYIFDNHYLENGKIPELWYTTQYSEAEWLDDLELLAARYKGKKGFIGIDTKNEPNRNQAKWGNGDPKTDWKMACEKAAARIASVNPDIITIHEATSTDPGLNEMIDKPLNVDKKKNALSIHLYGPDVWQDYGAGFKDPAFPANMPREWDKMLQKAVDQTYVIIGEWGGNYGNGWGKEKDKQWQDAFALYLTYKGLSSFYWCYTADSWDTGGILEADRKTVRPDKLALIRGLRTPYTTFLDELDDTPIITPGDTGNSTDDDEAAEETEGEEGEGGIIEIPTPSSYPEGLLRWFEQAGGTIPNMFQALAEQIVSDMTDGYEAEYALRKLLEAKEAAARACS